MSTFPSSSQFTFSFAQPSAPPSRIPEHLKTSTDIWDIVFRFLQDDPPTLKACALVKSLWTTLIYKHLHRKLVISRRLRRTIRPEDVSGAALIEALASSRILAYVKELGLEFKRLSSDSPTVPWWADQLHELHFEPLQAVHLIRADWDYEYMCFNKINLVEFLGNHPVKTLKLSECIITNTFSLRRLCRYNINTITELVLDQIERGSEPPMRMKRRYEEPTLCKLKSLKVHSVRHGWYVEELLLLDLDLSHLTTLHATTTSFSHPVPVNFLKNFEETVRHLKIIVTPEMADSKNGLWDCLSRFHLLETLHLVAEHPVIPQFELFNPPQTIREIYVELLLETEARVSTFTNEEAGKMNGWMNGLSGYANAQVVFVLAVPDAGVFGFGSRPKLVMPSLRVGQRKIVRILPDVQVKARVLSSP